MALTKITSSPQAVTSNYQPHPEAKALVQPGQSPTQYSQALQQGKFSQDHINFLAHGMPPRESVGWACQSSAKVADKMEPADKTALGAAQNWVKNPTPENQSAAGAAAAKTNYQGPGAWAAQGAAWAHPSTPGLTGHAVAGSVMLSAAKASGKMPAVPQAPTAPTAPTAPAFQAPKAPTFKAPAAPTAPTAPAPPTPPTLAERTQMAKIHQPFIDLGQGIASGQKPFI